MNPSPVLSVLEVHPSGLSFGEIVRVRGLSYNRESNRGMIRRLRTDVEYLEICGYIRKDGTRFYLRPKAQKEAAP